MDVKHSPIKPSRCGLGTEQYKSPGSNIYCNEFELNRWDVCYVA